MPHWLIAVIAVVLIGGLYLVSFWKTAKDEKARKILEQEELDQDRECFLFELGPGRGSHHRYL